MKIRKLVLVIADVLLLAVCIFAGINSAKKTVKYLEITEEPDEFIVEQPELKFSIVKEGEDWFVGEKNYPANASSVQSLIDSVSSIKILNKVGKSNNQASLDRYGLNDDQKIVVTVKSEGKIVKKLTIGKDSSTGTQSYVCFDDGNDIYLVSESFNSRFLKTPEDLRSDAAIFMEREDVTYVSITDADGTTWSVTTTGGNKETDKIIKTTGLTRDRLVPLSDDDENQEFDTITEELQLDDSKTIDWMGDLCYLMSAKWYDENAELNGQKVRTIKIKSGDITAVMDLFVIADVETTDYEGNPDTMDVYYAKSTTTPYPFELPTYSVNKYLQTPEKLVK